MTSKQTNNFLGILLVSLCVAGGIWGIIRQIKRRHTHEITTAMVYDYSIGGRGNASGIWVDFNYEVNHKQYKGSSLKSTEDIDASNIKKYMLNRTFPAAYEPNDPSNCELLIIPKDFKEFGYAFDGLCSTLSKIETAPNIGLLPWLCAASQRFIKSYAARPANIH